MRRFAPLTSHGVVAETFAADRATEAWPMWAALESACGANSIAASRIWNQAWSARFGAVVDHQVLIVRRDGVPLGAALLSRSEHREPGRVPVRTIHVGAAGEPEGEAVDTPNLRLLCRDLDAPQVARAVLDAIEADREWDELRADRLVTGSARALAGSRQDFAVEPVECLAATLPTVGTVAGGARARRRRRLRRALNAVPDPARVQVAEPTDLALAHEILDELIELSLLQNAARGRRCAFGHPRYVAFARDLVDGLVPRGRMLALRVRQGGHTLGCSLLLVEGDAALAYRWATRLARSGTDAPGYALHTYAIDAAAAAGLDRYDLLDGGGADAKALANEHRAVLSLHARRAESAGLRLAVRAATRRLIGAR